MRPIADNPRVGYGWLVGYVDGVLVVYAEQTLSDVDYAAYMTLLAEEIDGTDANARTAVLYEVAKGGSTDAPRRKQLANVVKPRRAKLQQILAGCAVATASPIARGIATALIWMVAPPWEVRFVLGPQEAFAWFAELLPSVDAERSFRRYDALKQHCRQSPNFR